MGRFRVLILGGTTEARELSQMLADDDRYEVIVSLKGVTRAPKVYAGTVITGGFGGEKGLGDYMKQARIDACINAVHPFAATMSKNARSAAEALAVSYLRLKRPPWRPQAGDAWLEVDTVEQATQAVGRDQSVFLALGAQGSEAFACIDSAHFLIRTADPVPRDKQWPNADYTTGLPNQNVDFEAELMKSYKITRLVARNSGGLRGYSKIVAARSLGVKVIMVTPPDEPRSSIVENPDAAHVWLNSKATG